MEVDAATYPHQLVGLLANISEADFVSFDLELTGIPSRLPGKEPWKPRGGGRKTLENRYLETKEGAERYQILQVGITCGRFDHSNDRYVLRPYNITISPLLDERLDIEREISIQSGAASFLLSHGFDLGAPFARGVQYLSREEAKRAKQMAYDRFDKKNVVADLQLKDEDKESLDFVKRVREAIVEWKTDSLSMLEITTHTGLPEQPLVPVISRFEKRLAHQLVRAEFPELVSMGKANCIRIIHFDADREAENTRRLKIRVKESIARQTGFRWVFEALVKGDIHEADPSRFGATTGGYTIAADSSDVKTRFDRTQDRLMRRQPVLVGHNMFTDIVYLYKTFVGELPDTLDEFCEVLQELFPRIIDTKYLATHTEGDLNTSPSLQEIAEGLEGQPLPEILTHGDHAKYHNTTAFHEAGYDSLLTATIMLRLAAKLHAERQGKSTEANADNFSESSFTSAVERQAEILDGREKVDHPVSLPPIEEPHQGPEQSQPKRKRTRNKKSKEDEVQKPPEARFQTQNIFDKLRELSLEHDSAEESSSSEEILHTSIGEVGSSVNNSKTTSWQEKQYAPDKSKWAPIQTKRRKPMEMIPAFDSDFWDKFGNTLRVFGTQEAVLKIAPWKKET